MLSDQNVINNYIPQKFDTNPHSNELITKQSAERVFYLRIPITRLGL